MYVSFCAGNCFPEGVHLGIITGNTIPVTRPNALCEGTWGQSQATLSLSPGQMYFVRVPGDNHRQHYRCHQAKCILGWYTWGQSQATQSLSPGQIHFGKVHLGTIAGLIPSFGSQYPSSNLELEFNRSNHHTHLNELLQTVFKEALTF